jgi:hypothetical protein
MSTDLAMFDEVKAALAEMKLKVENTIFPCETPEDIKAIRSFCAKFSKINGEIDRQHKAAKAQALAVGRAYDAEKNTLKAAVKEMKDTVFAPVKAIEAAEKAAALAKMEQDRLDKEEADRKELAELRAKQEESNRKEREAKIAEEAAAKALADAKQKAKETAERAKKAKERAVAKVKAEAQAKEDARIKEENRITEEKRKADETERLRIADVEHRSKIESEVLAVLEDLIADPAYPCDVLNAIKDGKVPHLKIIY